MFRFRPLLTAVNKRIPQRGNVAFYTPSAEPKYLVRKDSKGDPKALKVPYLRDSVREEMYARHMSDPQEWSFTRLSQAYRSSLMRTKAVVLLMHKRFNMMREKGLNVEIIKDTKPYVKVTIPEVWESLYKKYTESESKNIEEVLKSYNESAEVTKRANLSTEEATKIIDNLKDHFRRVDNCLEHQKRMDRILQKFARVGVNTSFRETDSRATHSGGKAALRDIYAPKLYGDDDFEKGKEALLKRIEFETRGHVEHNREFYHDKFATPGSTSTPATPAATTETTAPVVSRWKLAFKDTSNGDHVPGKPTEPTTVRTRSGQVRKASPLEESQFSWNPAPSPLDMQINAAFSHFSDKFVTPFQNVDGDDDLPSKIAKAKLEERRNKVEENKQKK